MPYFQLLRNPWKDTGDMRAVSALSAVKEREGEQKVSPLSSYFELRFEKNDQV